MSHLGQDKAVLFERKVTVASVVAATTTGVSGQAAQPVPLAQLKLSMTVYGQKRDGRSPDEQPKQLTPPSFERDVKLGFYAWMRHT